MRSYIHQQRCHRQQMEVRAEVEEAQGGDVGSTAKEAAAMPIKPRGGTNGWGVNRTSSWCWQRVLLVLLVWLT